MVKGCGAKCAKYFLFTLNFFFFLGGAALLGIGLWMRFDDKIAGHITSNESLKKAFDFAVTLQKAYAIFIAFGTFVFVVGFLGCFGAVRESKCLLGFYIAFVFVVIAGELGAGIYAVVWWNSFKSAFDGIMKADIQQNYANGNSTINDAVMAELSCCGWNNYTDFGSNSSLLPKPCCHTVSLMELCKTEVAKGKTDHVFDGCGTVLQNMLKTFGSVFIGVAAGIAGLEIIVLIAAIGLCCSIE